MPVENLRNNFDVPDKTGELEHSLTIWRTMREKTLRLAYHDAISSHYREQVMSDIKICRKEQFEALTVQEFHRTVEDGIAYLNNAIETMEEMIVFNQSFFETNKRSGVR